MADDNPPSKTQLLYQIASIEAELANNALAWAAAAEQFSQCRNRQYSLKANLSNLKDAISHQSSQEC